MNSIFTGIVLLLLYILQVKAACPNKCSGHGTCGDYDRCTCMQFWTNPDCSGRICPYVRAWVDKPTAVDDAHNYAECGNRGECDRTSGECVCYDGFTGSGCRRTVCPNHCNGHGVCQYIEEYTTSFTYSGWDREKILGCKCDPVYEGSSCEKRMCPKGDDPLTTGDYEMRQYFILHHATTIPSNFTFYITFNDVYGNSYNSESIALGNSNTAFCSNIETALGHLPNRILATVTVQSASTYYPLTRQLSPYVEEALTTSGTSVANTDYGCIVIFPVEPGTTGYQSLLIPVYDTTHYSAGHQPLIVGVSDTTTFGFSVGEDSGITLNSGYRVLREQLTCAGRGNCDITTGKCNCYLGQSGAACQKQEALV